MSSKETTRQKLHVQVEKWPLKSPFRITGHTFTELDVVVVSLEQGGNIGRGEAAGVYYLRDDVASMVKSIEAVRASVEAGVDRQGLQRFLPAGGARNALDCALWELEAHRSGRAAWQIAGLEAPKARETTYTLGAASAANMALGARAFADARALKVKLTGDAVDIDRLHAVRDARPDVWLGVDANQGYTRQFLERMLPVFASAQVKLIEQPFPIGAEAQLADIASPHSDCCR